MSFRPAFKNAIFLANLKYGYPFVFSSDPSNESILTNLISNNMRYMKY